MSGRDAASTIRQVIGGIMALLSTQPITWAAALLMTAYIPRYLDGRAMGELSIAMSTAAVVGTFASFGMMTVLTRTVASRAAGAAVLVSTSLVLLLLLAAAGSTLTATVGLSSGLIVVGGPILVLALAAMMAGKVQDLLLAVLAGQQRLGEFAWLNAASLLTASVISVAALMLGGGGPAVLTVSLVVTVLMVSFIWRRVGLHFEFGGITRAGVLALATAGLPFLAWDLLLRVRGDVDAIVLGRLLSVEAAGWWSAAQRIGSIPVFVPVLVMTPLLPALSGVKADREVFVRTLRRAFELTVIVTTGISAALAAFAPLVPTTLGWSPDYGAAVPLIQISSPTLILVSISMVLGTALIALGDERRWLLANVVATIAQFVVLFAVIPLAEERLGNGAIGAAVARIVAESIMLVSAQILLPRGMVGVGAWLFVARVAVVGIASTVAVLPLVERSIIVAGALWVLTYAAGLLILRVVRPSDLSAVAQVTVATLRRRARPAGP